MLNLTRKERTIVALDVPDLEGMKTLLDQLEGVVTFYKIGFELFTAHGWKAVEMVKERGGRVFLDLKLHDIPNTVAKTAAVICKHKVDMFNVHALGGAEMMQKTYKTVLANASKDSRPIVIAVTILTSHDQRSLNEDLKVPGDVASQVKHLAFNAQQAGLDGVVSSPLEIQTIRETCGEQFQIVTPGIRPAGSEVGDQKRIMDPKAAFEAGSSFIVIGRPITQAENPREAAETIFQTL